ncbi:MAG: arginine--tRNA ligase [Bacilli bacterium]|nr:arginine--tRNA ligase [Bacilli bacterium]
MVDIKKELSTILNKEVSIDTYTLIKEIKEKDKGDYTFPCFVLAKELHKAPNHIADDLKDKINSDLIEKIESVNGYLNFYINKEFLMKEVFNEYESKKDEYGNEEQTGKTVCIDYSAPNIAKPFHVGHLRSTVIGHALYNIYKYLGYNTIGINHLGDYGTQFGKLIEGYKLWSNEYDIENNPIDELVKIYVRINALAEENPEVLERCRNNFKLLEEGDEYCVNLWKKFSELSLKEFDKIYDLLGIKFDSIKGESFYIDKMDEVVKILEKNNKITISEGAKIVDLEEEGIKTPCIIIKSDGSSIYATRDLAAILYRSRTYDYDKSLYVTSYEQDLQFKQTFAVAKYLDLDPKYVDGLEHVSFGMYRLPEGKFSTRKGNFIKLEDILNDAIEKAKAKVSDKNPDLEDIDDVAKKVGVGAVVFGDLYNSRIKDEVFDIDEMLEFQGETCPYIQYMYVRIKSILRKLDKEVLINDVKYDKLHDDLSYELVKQIYNFNSVLKDVTEKNEPYILSRYLIKLAQTYSDYYNSYKILSDDIDERNSRVYLINIVANVLKTGCHLLGIEMPEKM